MTNKIKNSETFFLKDVTEVTLHNYEQFGQGKIIISNPYNQNYSYYWGSMGVSIQDFLLQINESYFTNCLCSPGDNGVFDGKKSVHQIRYYIRYEMKHDLPWYKFMEQQKELREYLKDAEECENEYQFVDYVSSIPKKFNYYTDGREFVGIVEGLCTEPWNFIEKSPSQNTIFLKKIFKEIQKQLKNKTLK